MSLIPFILDLADELHDFNRCLTTGMDVDDFGFGIYPHEFQQQQLQQQQQLRRPRAVSQLYWLPNTKQRHHPYYRSKACCGNKTPSSQLNDPEKEAVSDKEGAAPNTGTAAGKSAYSVVNRNGFQVSMNVKQFTPNELTVKTIDNCIVVEGRHEDKEDGHGVISRHFIRKYMLPKGYDPNEVLSTLSSDGILTVKAPPPATKADEHSERIVDIQQTGPAQTNAAAKDTSKEQTNTTKAAAAEAVAATAAAAALPQQQQPLELQKPKQKQQPEQQNVVTERNGDSNSKEINAEQETEPEPAATAAVIAAASEQDEEQPMLVSNIVVAPAAIDAIMAAATADEGNEQDANVNNNTNNDNGIADIPVTIASDVDMETATNPEAASATVVAVVEELVDGIPDGASVVVEAVVENLVVAEKAPTAADLVAAADAAIILAKTQCENGNKTATASSEEGVAN